MKKVFKALGIIIIIVVFGGTILFLYNKSKPQQEVFEIVSPFYTDVISKTVATGAVVPRKEIDVKPQVSGIITDLYVQAGDIITKNQVIAKIEIIPEMVELNSAESRLNQANINFEDAKVDYERQQKLFDDDVISYDEFKQAKVAYDSAKEELETAGNNLELIKNGVTKKAGSTTNTLVRSTIEGMVLDVPVKEGNSVIQSNTFNDGTTIAIIADMQDMIFEGKVDETEVGKIQEGMPIELEIGAIEKEKFDAILTYIAPKGVEENGAIQFEIKADVSLLKDQFIRSGYSANANIVLDRKDNVLVIPESVLKFEGDIPYIEILVNEVENIYERRNVQVGLSDGINIEITDGLDENDKIKGDKIDPAIQKQTINQEG